MRTRPVNTLTFPRGRAVHGPFKYSESHFASGTKVAEQLPRGRFLKPVSADDVLFGNTFDRPLKLPWGTTAALKFMK